MSRDSKLSIRPLTPTLGAEIGGVDLTAPLDARVVADLRKALLDHLVLFFRDQEMTPEQQLRFSEYFAPVMIPTIDTTSTALPGVTLIDQTAPKGEYTDRWHTDHTFAEQTPLGAVLRAVELPSQGGDTCFASMYAAYDALSPRLQGFLETLHAVHSTEIVTRALAHMESVKTHQARESIHPVVRVHPETGRKLLFVCGNFTTRIVELADAESDALLALLFEHIKNAAFQCRFHWELNSVAFWDNRCTQHCAIPDYTERRLMQRTMLLGDRPFGVDGRASNKAIVEALKEFGLVFDVNNFKNARSRILKERAMEKLAQAASVSNINRQVSSHSKASEPPEKKIESKQKRETEILEIELARPPGITKSMAPSATARGRCGRRPSCRRGRRRDAPPHPLVDGVEPGVLAAAGQQLGVAPLLDHPPLRQHHDPVGVADGGEPVGDHQGGAVARRAEPHERLEGALHLALALGVEGAGGLVEDQDGRVLEEGAGDGEALPLAAREQRPLLADLGVVALRQRA